MILAINRAMRRITKGSALRQWMVAMALCALTLLGAQWARAQEAVASAAGVVQEQFHFFSFMTSDHYSSGEKLALWVVLGVAFMGLGYALLLVKQVREADQGTEKMQKVAAAIRSGANAYLGQQFRKIVVLIAVLTVVLFLTRLAGTPSPDMYAVAFGRAGAFLAGSLFSFCVGFVGMRFATLGNLRVAAAARTSFGGALQVGYRTGTITGMLTDGLGLLGGTVIFMMYGEKAYEVLLGFGFGGTLIALFMRVGGGIYTKAADVGADLVGKIEAGIPEDDPRNAATIADNVGDNVGDCAGMAADIFESYEVTIVAAMILGLRVVRPQGRDLPAAGARHRRHRLDHQHLQRALQGRRFGRRGVALGASRFPDRLRHQRDRVFRAGLFLPAVRRGVPGAVSAIGRGIPGA